MLYQNKKFVIQTYPKLFQTYPKRNCYKLSYPSISIIEGFLEECNGKPKKPLHKNCVQKWKIY